MSTAVRRRELDSAREVSWPATLSRRCVSIPAVGIGAVVALAAAPVWLPLAAAIDLFRRPRCALRCGLFFTVYLWCEVLGLLAALATARPRGGRLAHAAAVVGLLPFCLQTAVLDVLVWPWFYA